MLKDEQQYNSALIKIIKLIDNLKKYVNNANHNSTYLEIMQLFIEMARIN